MKGHSWFPVILSNPKLGKLKKTIPELGLGLCGKQGRVFPKTRWAFSNSKKLLNYLFNIFFKFLALPFTYGWRRQVSIISRVKDGDVLVCDWATYLTRLGKKIRTKTDLRKEIESTPELSIENRTPLRLDSFLLGRFTSPLSIAPHKSATTRDSERAEGKILFLYCHFVSNLKKPIIYFFPNILESKKCQKDMHFWLKILNRIIYVQKY